MNATQQRYGGLSADERIAARRVRLLEAGLELFGTRGYAATTIDEVCAEAGLIKRYFYESFKSREELLVAVYDDLATEAARRGMDAIAAAPDALEARVRDGVGAVVGFFIDDPRRGRVVLLEAVGASEELERRRREQVQVFATLIRSYAAEYLGDRMPSEEEAYLASGALVGAAAELAIEQLLGTLAVSPARLADYLTGMAFSLLSVGR